MNRRRNDNGATKYLITVLTIICIVLISVTLLRPGTAAPVRSVTGIIVTPVQKGISVLGHWLSGFNGNLADVNMLREENEQLKEQVDTLMAENSQLVLDKEELDRLRVLLDLADEYSDYEKVGAHVISKDSGNWFSTFTIDKGIADGIRVNCNVLAGSGLAGIVTAVGPNWARVRSIIDDNSNVSAMVSTTSDTCIIAGNLELIDSGALNLVKLTDSENKVHVGDKIVTSNISEKYLPGILIGYISELNNDANNLTKSGKITPVVDFRHMQEVLVILELKQYVAENADASAAPVIDVTSDQTQTQQTEQEN
ncbi:MAG: rod shape-determining protein MreC [Lachnospiraceae bacterium]|nr:rod shape-determining protein MreC [Lachnospiraceae bacterium]